MVPYRAGCYMPLVSSLHSWTIVSKVYRRAIAHNTYGGATAGEFRIYRFQSTRTRESAGSVILSILGLFFQDRFHLSGVFLSAIKRCCFRRFRWWWQIRFLYFIVHLYLLAYSVLIIPPIFKAISRGLAEFRYSDQVSAMNSAMLVLAQRDSRFIPASSGNTEQG